ncbi:MAG: uroporphyrinogen-III C-methyltransferase [Burkholderiales bacterium]
MTASLQLSSGSSPSQTGFQAPAAQREVGAALVRWLALLLALLALAVGIALWQRIGNMQEQLARQSAESLARSVEARTLARDARDLVRDSAGKLALLEARVSEVSLQRSQIEELMRNMSRSRDDTLVVDLESTLRFAQQQAQLTGSAGPLVAALKSSAQRIERAAQPRLSDVQRAIALDLEKINAARLVDTAGLAAKLDDLSRMVSDLPVANAVGPAAGDRRQTAPGPGASAEAPTWWGRALEAVADETYKLVRVSRIEQPEAALLSPEQSFFLRENLKLTLQSVRLALLARHMESARADLAAATASLNKYFDPAARKTQIAAGLLQQVRAQAQAVEFPRIDETLAALSTAAR